MIKWRSIFDSQVRPPIDKRILIGRYDYGFAQGKEQFTSYIGKLKHPASESAKFHPDYHHWMVETPQGEQAWEVAATDVWTEFNAPEREVYETREEAEESNQSGQSRGYCA